MVPLEGVGTIVIAVGGSGPDYGYKRGSYGSLDSGSFPGDLFGDTNSRDVDAIYEDADGFWYFTYRGGLGGDWNTDSAAGGGRSPHWSGGWGEKDMRLLGHVWDGHVPDIVPVR